MRADVHGTPAERYAALHVEALTLNGKPYSTRYVVAGDEEEGWLIAMRRNEAGMIYIEEDDDGVPLGRPATERIEGVVAFTMGAGFDPVRHAMMSS